MLQRAVVGPCFACGEMGHLRMYCPKTQVLEKKWYLPLTSFHVCGSVLECDLLCVGGNTVGSVCMAEGKETLGSHFLPSPNMATSSNGITVANTCIVGGNEGSEESDESDDTGSGSDESIGDSNSGHGVEELVSCSGGARSVKPSVKGRLRQCLPFWKEEIGAPHTILEIIEHGYVLPLMSEPTARLGKNCLSAFRHAQFVDESVKELLEAGCIARLPEVPHVSSPLSVVENSLGKKRLVVVETEVQV